MLAEAKRDNLLYLSDPYSSAVHVFSYPAVREVGMLVVDGDPEGECVDNAGDVWVVRFLSHSAVEYRHGETSISGSVSTGTDSPWSCAVDPITGNLAVTTNHAIDLYQSAKGDPTAYASPRDGGYESCTYDESGNLFAATSLDFIAELPKGSSQMIDLRLSFSIYPHNIQWDQQHRYLAISNSRYGRTDATSIYRVAVFGKAGNLVGITVLKQSKNNDPPQYWIEGSHILGTTLVERKHGHLEKRIDSWPYPAGGKPTLIGHVDRSPTDPPELHGIVISEATR
jgi:hypothetical protein